MSLLHRSRHQDDHATYGNTNTSAVPTSDLVYRPSHPKASRRRSSGLKFFASSSTSKPEPTHNLHKKWEADYLKDLRVNRPARPGGSRPFPSRADTSTAEPYARAASALSFRPSCSMQQADPIRGSDYGRSASALSHRGADPETPITKLSMGVASREFSTSKLSSASRINPSGTYRESGMRWAEKQEARSLREALEDMDLLGEAKLHAAAQDEASELVWRHRHQGLTHTSPGRLRSGMQHLGEGAYAPSQSVGPHAEQSAARGESTTSHGPVSNTSNSSRGDSNPSQTTRSTVVTFAEPEKPSEEALSPQGTGHKRWDSPQKKSYMSLKNGGLPKISGRRRSSGPRARDVSDGIFRNPEDKIYEEPDVNKPSEAARLDQSRIPGPLATKNRNTLSQNRAGSYSFIRPRFASTEDKMRVSRSEIHRNQPSQSRNPSYMKNTLVSTPPGPVPADYTESHTDFPRTKEGKEVRGDDIKAATSMRMKDRSPKLPSPTVVSNRPGRPIVSFEQDWKPKDTGKQEDPFSDIPSAIPARLSFKPKMPASTASAPVVPTINVPDTPSIQIDEATPCNQTSIPSIFASEAPIPTISLPEHPPTTRPLPSPSSRSHRSPANRPLPHHSATTPVHSSKLHWTPSSRRATAQCAACALPIEGRIVSAASQRFHPHCFTCHHCAEPLECVAFYPEPDSARAARIERIEARLAYNTHALPDEKEGETAADDGDSSLRFYCHLDYHELYSPRCRSCKTPIESEVVLACGGSWHVGHFFCAECGDPFDAKTPFVEKNGYAWCVACHAGKFSGKCKGCRKPVVEGGVNALGSEWHVDCFCCVECGGQFEDGRFFTRGDEEKPEAETSVVVLEKDDPATVCRMLTYLYTLDYDDDGPSASAECYMANGPDAATSQALPTNNTPPLDKNLSRRAKMMNNVAVYAIANKYDIGELKELATARFHELLWAKAPTDALHDIIRAVFGTTTINDPAIRNVVVEYCADYSTEILRDDGLCGIIKDNGELGVALLQEADGRAVNRFRERKLLHRKLVTLKGDLRAMIAGTSTTKSRAGATLARLLQELKTTYEEIEI